MAKDVSNGEDVEDVTAGTASSSKELSDVSLRLWTTLSVFFFLAGFGLPLWWSTTTVYRASLPTYDIDKLSSMKVLLAVRIELLAEVYHSQRKEDVQETLQALLQKDASSLPGVTYIIDVVPQRSWLIDLLSSSHGNAHEILSALASRDTLAPTASGDSILTYSVVLQDISVLADGAKSGGGGAGDAAVNQRPVSVSVGHGRYSLLQHHNADIGSISDAIVNATRQVLLQRAQARSAYLAAASEELAGSKAKRGNLMAVTSTAGYRLAFTLVNPRPDQVRVTWDIKAAVARHMEPFLKQVAPLADFTFDTQVLHYVSSNLVPRRQGDVYQLRESQLPHMINPLESALGSHTSNLSTLHFIVYIPDAEQSPLLIVDKKGKPAASNSFVIHRWGSVLVHNVNSSENAGAAHVLPAEELASMMSVFTGHLKSLLGITGTPGGLSNQINVQQPSSMSVTHWEWNNLLFSRTVENLARSRTTLQALVKLLDDVSNMVIADHIQQEVLHAVAFMDKSLSQLRNGYLNSAYASSQLALVASEKAFFDPSMLALLYFPEESKYAIYVPLFIPMAVPVLASLVQSIKLFKQLRQARQQQQQPVPSLPVADKLKVS